MLFGEFYFDKAVNSVAKGKSLYTAAFKYSFIFSHQDGMESDCMFMRF